MPFNISECTGHPDPPNHCPTQNVNSVEVEQPSVRLKMLSGNKKALVKTLLIISDTNAEQSGQEGNLILADMLSSERFGCCNRKTPKRADFISLALFLIMMCNVTNFIYLFILSVFIIIMCIYCSLWVRHSSKHL